MQEKKVIAYKGFDENLRCKGFQYEVGKEYMQEGDIECCLKGFHACTNPLDVLNYYGANLRHRFCIVEQSGTIIGNTENAENTKQASSKIKIVAEIGMAGLFKAAVEWIKEKTDPMPIIEATKDKDGGSRSDHVKFGSTRSDVHISSSGDYVMIGSSGDSAQIGSSGDHVQIGSIGGCVKIGSSGSNAEIGANGGDANIGSSGNFARIGSSGSFAQIGSSGSFVQIGSSGNRAQIGSSGDHAEIGASGDFAQIGSSGDHAHIGSSGHDVRICSSGQDVRISSSGNYSRIASSGNYAQVESTGEASIICCTSHGSVAKAKKGTWITLAEWKYSEDKGRVIPVCVKTEYVDGERIKEDTWYELVNGEFVEFKHAY